MREKLAANDIGKGCPVCGANDFYLRKAFPKAAGIGIVIVAALLTFVFIKYELAPSWAIYAPLFAAAILDAILYKLTPDAPGCYRCKTVFFGISAPPSLPAYDLEHAEEIRLGRKVGSRPEPRPAKDH